MSDTLLNEFVASGTAAERAAFTPVPPTPASGPDSGYFFFETDTGLTYSWDGAVWVLTGGGGSTIPATVQGDILYATAANTLAALAKDANATRYLSNTGGTNNPAWAQVALANGVSGDLPYANLTQGSALSVLGVTGNSTADVASIAAGTDGFVLRRSGTALAFGTLASGAFPSSMFVPLYATLIIVDADIKKLPTVPLQIVATPGVGFRIKFLAGTFQTGLVTAGYTGLNTTSSALNFRMSATGAWVSSVIVNDNSVSLTNLTDFLGAVTVGIQDVIPYQEAPSGYVIPQNISGTATTNYEDSALMVGIDNGGVDLGGGNAANVLKCRAWYVIEAV